MISNNYILTLPAIVKHLCKHIILIALLIANLHHSGFANAMLDSLLKVAKDSGEDSVYIDALNKAAYQIRNSNPEQGYLYANQALQLAQKTHYKKGEAESFRQIGLSFKVRGDYDKAMNYYLKSLEKFKALNDKLGMGEAINNIGNIYKRNNKLKTALDYFIRAMKLREEIGYKRGMGISYTNVGQIYAMQGQHQKAINYFDKALVIFNALKNQYRIGRITFFIGQSYHYQKKYEKAIEYYQNALEIRKNVNDINGVSDVLIKMASIHITKGEHNIARGEVNQAYALAREIDAKQLLALSYLYISKLDSIDGDYLAAFENYKYYKNMQDSIASSEIQKQILELEAKYHKVQQDAQIEQQKQEIESRKKTQLILITGIILVLVFLVALVFLITKKIKANNLLAKQKNQILEKNKILEQQKEEITAQSEEQNRLNKALSMTNSEIEQQKEEIMAANEELKATNDALVESEEKFRAISDMSPIGLIVFDRFGENIYSNAINEEISGLNQQETYGKGWIKAIHFEDKDDYLKKLEKWQKSEKKVFDARYRYKHTHSGKIVWVDSKMSKMFIDNELFGYVMVVEDISDKIKSQEALELSQKTLHKVLNNLDALVYVIDFETCDILFANEAFKRVFGTSEGKCNEVIYPKSFCATCQAKNLVVTDKDMVQFDTSEYHNYRNNRDYLIVENAILWIDRRFVRIAFATDITERKKMEATITKQKEEIEKQNRNLTSSIFYAKRIQQSLLPQDEYFNHLLPEHFILYKPRDIVSGDFYWIKEIENKIILAVADCTGHGVPGAFMSLLGISSLNEIISNISPDDKSVFNPASILNRLRNKVITSLRQKGRTSVSRDGMDMALCIIDFEKHLIHYAGANSPLLITQNFNKQNTLNVISGDKMPVGVRKLNEPDFSYRTITFQTGDLIYLFTDGFLDQFGGIKGRKFLRSNFKKLLHQISHLPIIEQRQTLEKEYFDWINPKGMDGKYKQIDDILVVGIKLVLEREKTFHEKDLSNYTLLLAEDDHDAYLVIKNYLKPTNVNLVWAKNGYEAIDNVKSMPEINLVLMDMQMPEIDGLEATQKIKSIRNIPVLFETAFSETTDKEKAFLAGCDDFIKKPIQKDELLNKVIKYLEIL